jgi:hypothetical protein
MSAAFPIHLMLLDSIAVKISTDYGAPYFASRILLLSKYWMSEKELRSLIINIYSLL